VVRRTHAAPRELFWWLLLLPYAYACRKTRITIRGNKALAAVRTQC